MGRRSLTLLILALVAFGGLAWLLSRGRGLVDPTTAANLPDAQAVDRAPDREELVAAPEVVTQEPEREAQAAAPERSDKRLFGRVTDNAGRGVAGARVLLYDARRDSLRGLSEFTLTETSGRYGMDHDLEAGHPLGLLVSAEGFLTSVHGPVQASDDQQEIDLAIGEGEGLAGRVLWEDGKPATDASLEIRGETRDAAGAQGMQKWRSGIQSILGRVETDSSGHFVLRGSAAGLLSIRARGKREEGVGYGFADGIRVGNADLEIILRGDHELDVEILDDVGEPVVEVTFILLYGLDRTGGMHPDDRAMKLTAEDGQYHLEGLRRGDWSVRVRADAYCTANEGDDLAIASMPQDAPVRFTLLRPGSVSGQLLDSLGNPLAEALVELRTGAGRSNARTNSDEDGSFRIDRATAGPAVLWSEAGSLVAQLPVDVLPGQETKGVVLRFSAGGTVRLLVVDAEGQPLATCMTFLLAGTEDLQDEETDELGMVVLGPVTPGEYTVAAILIPSDEVDDDGVNMLENLRTVAVEVLEGEEIQVTLRPATRPVVELSGHVTLAGEPVRDESFMLFREGAVLVEAIRQLSTDEDGAYRVKLDGPGAFLMMMQSHDSALAVARFEVPGVAHHVLDIELPEGRIEGRVLGVEEFRPLVTLEREDGSLNIPFPEMSEGVTTKADGHFVFEFLQPGTFTLRVRGNQGRSWRPLTGLRLRHGQVLTNIELTPASGGAVSGEVRGPGGAPETAALVFLRSPDGTVLHPAGTPTDEQGRFRVEGVPAGHWTLSAHSAGLASASRAIDTSGIDLDDVSLLLATGGLLEVRLLDASGNLASATLRAFDASGLDVSQLFEPALRSARYTAVLDPSLRRFGPLPPGQYRLVAEAPDGREAERTVRIVGGEQVAVELVLQ